MCKKKDKTFLDLTKYLEKNHKVKIEIVELDLTKKDVIKCANSILKKEKSIDILINNAGILFNSLFLMTPEDKLNEIFQVNFFSQILFTQSISRTMMKNRKGNIIFVASTSE